MATYIKTDGTVIKVSPKNGERFMLEELQKFVGGLVEFLPLPSGKIMYCNDEGKLDGLPKNEKATKIWKKEYPIEKYSENNDELIVGDVLVLTAEEDKLQG